MAAAGIVTGSVTLQAAFSEYITSGVMSPQTLNEALNALGLVSGSLSWSNGTGAGQIDLLYAQPLLLSGTTTTIDFTSVNDPGAGSIAFARARFFMVFNPNSTAGHDCKVSQGASNGWLQLGSSSNPQVARANGGFVLLCDPKSTGAGNGAVITSTSKTILFDPGASTITVYVLVAGGSAA